MYRMTEPRQFMSNLAASNWHKYSTGVWGCETPTQGP
jgi:hypothetical protein